MALPEIILPKWMTKIGTKLPGKPPRFVLVSVLNTMLRKGLLPADMELLPEENSKSKFWMPVSKCGLVPIRKNSWTTTSVASPI